MFLSLLRSETAASPERMAAALKGLRAYQQAPRPAPLPSRPIVARHGPATIRDYGGNGPPVLFVPSLINPPDVLDLDRKRSLLRWLADRDLRVLLVDWGVPAEASRELTIAGHVETLLLPLIDALGEAPILAGYCLGGTMATAAAALRPARGLALIATPWRFRRYSDATRASLDALWRQSESPVETLGLMPMEVLQTAFWRLDPGRTIEKYERFGALDVDDRAARAFVRLEDWANDGPPLTAGAARELFVDLFENDMTGQGQWVVGGKGIDPATLNIPVLEITSTVDRIVPATTTPGVGDRLDLALGHVGMIVGGRARDALWKPLAAWLSRVGTS